MKSSNKNYSNFSDNELLNQYLQEKKIPKTNPTEEEEDSIVPWIVIITIWLVIYTFTYIFRIELNFWYSIISNSLAIIAIYHIIRIVDGEYWGTKNRESFLRKFYKTIFIIIMISLIPLGVYLESKHYYRNRIYLEKMPIEIPPALMNANKNTFFSELKNYEEYSNTPKRLFYFDLQWSLRYAKNAKQKAQYQRLEQLYMQRKNSNKVRLDILTYNLYEALLNETNKDSILHYINQIHPGNVYEIKYVRFRRIAKSRHDIAATPEEEESLSYGAHSNVQTHSRRPRGLLQAIENLETFTKEEKIQMLEHVLKCFIQWAITNGCPQEAINECLKYLNPYSNWYISHYIGKGIGMYEVEESLWKMRDALFDSVPGSKIFVCYSLEDWETFVKSKKLQ